MTEVGNLKQKLDDIDNLLVDAIQNYHTPSRFFTYSSAAMQAIRTFTLAVQSNKTKISGFNTWYTQWRDNMKTDRRMKWLHDKRNEVAHTDVLSSDSHATIFTIADYRQAKFERQFDCRTSNEELLAAAQEQIAKHPGLAHTTISVSRKYVVEIDGKPYELLQLVAYGFNYLRLLYADLLYYLETGKLDAIPSDLSKMVEQESTSDEWYRYFTFKADGGQSVQMGGISVKRDEKVIKQLVKEFGKPPKKMSKDMPIKEAAEAAFNLAKLLIEQGSSLVPTVYICNSKGYQPLMVAFSDRAEKLKFAFDLPGLLEQHKATGVIFVAEAWSVEPKRMLKRLNEGKSVDKLRKKDEALWLTMLTKDLETLDITASILRTDKGTEFSEPRITSPSPETLNFLHPVYLWWKKEPVNYSAKP